MPVNLLEALIGMSLVQANLVESAAWTLGGPLMMPQVLECEKAIL